MGCFNPIMVTPVAVFNCYPSAMLVQVVYRLNRQANLHVDACMLIFWPASDVDVQNRNVHTDVSYYYILAGS